MDCESIGHGHGCSVGGTGVCNDNGVRGKLSNGASGCRISYKNSGMIGTDTAPPQKRIYILLKFNIFHIFKLNVTSN